MNPTTIVLLRIVHILFGVFWVGSLLFMARFLMPSLRAVGPAGAPIMQQLTQVLKMPVYLTTAGGLAVLSGIALYWHDSGGFQRVWLESPTGRVFGLGGLLAITGLIVGLTINKPAATQMTELAMAIGKAGGKPTPEQAAEMKRLQGRLYSATQVIAGLLLLATTAMAIARYV